MDEFYRHRTPPADGKEEWTREQMQKIARLVYEELPEGWGFFVMAFPYGGKPGAMNYVGKAPREDVLRLMQEFIAKNKKEG